MELWVFEEQSHRPLGIVDAFISLRLVWRYEEPGTLEMILPLRTELLLKPGMLLWPKGQREAFIVETTRIQETEKGASMIVHGRTASCLLQRRCLHQARFYQGTGGAIIQQMLSEVFAAEARRFPGFSFDVKEGLGSTISYLAEPMDLLEGIVHVCRATGLGFVCDFDPGRGTLVFRLREGADHTATGARPVIFDTEYDNLARPCYTESIADMANVAYVLGEVDTATELRKWAACDPSGAQGYGRFEAVIASGKRSVMEKEDGSGSIIRLNGAQYQQLLLDFGREQLALREKISTTEGELVAEDQLFRQGVDYGLGDVVRIRASAWDMENDARIKELEELYEKGIKEVRLVIGRRMPTLLDKMKRL